MIANYTATKTVTTTGDLILEFDKKDIDSALITCNKDIKIGFGDLSQAVMPILAYSAFSLSYKDFRSDTVEKIYNLLNIYLLKKPAEFQPEKQTIRIYAKGASETANVYISYLGGNR